MAISEYLEEVIDDNIKYTSKGDEVHFNCPKCGDIRHRMFVNLSSHVFYCQNCGYTGTFVSFIKDIEGISFEQARQRYKEITGSMYLPEDIVAELRENISNLNVQRPELPKRAIPLPDEYSKLNFLSRNPVNKRALKYLKERMVSLKQIKEHHMGYCIDGQYESRIILPIYENTELRFWVARAIGNNHFRKEMSPTNEEYQISKSQVIFNIYNAAKLYGSAVISEGIFDACPWGEIGTSLLGKRMSDDQLAILLSYKDYLPDGVYIALDYDARKDAVRMADMIYQYMPVKIVNIPEGYDDPNFYARKFGREALFELLNSAVEYDIKYKLKQKFFIV
jgi:DNA primase